MTRNTFTYPINAWFSSYEYIIEEGGEPKTTSFAVRIENTVENQKYLESNSISYRIHKDTGKLIFRVYTT